MSDETFELEKELVELEEVPAGTQQAASSSSSSSSSTASADGPKPTPSRSLWKSASTYLSILRFSAINLLFPFINGVMLGFGEIVANEIGIRWGFIGAEVHPIRINIRREVERRQLEEAKKKKVAE
ncbi:outer membrane protein TOM13-domain-containing protein [Lipomyces tetrasporus]|uniref:Outer membrane protein TOM13-domain-containing protein n=1 Tax=Lipomyces tetrasporus TaxID=54092 RepID=A0AAD7VVV7_9ASCO|nr:outer membrane protein TOM13-domain-containing protein [Lipomyces tetrasporus]KAJ8103928.1 outer membrane protein TOM13-domain-containing protein [Lipomyces tetrasporus]